MRTVIDQEDDSGPTGRTGLTGSTGARPISSARYGQLRDAVLTVAAAALAETKRPLWFAESLVLSARYQQWLRSSDWARGARRFRDRLELWQVGTRPRLARAGATVLEFGVADGLATQWWAETQVPFARWHGFDTFEGLPGDWTRAGVPVMAAGVFSPGAGVGATPDVVAAYPHEWHRGLIEDTLPGVERPDTPLFVMIDVDLLEPTKVILGWLHEHGRAGDLVYFDEAFDPWNEGLAIREAHAQGLRFEAIGYTGSALLIELR